MNWSCRFTVVDVSLPVEMESEWCAAAKLLLDALERVDSGEMAVPNNNPSPESGVAQSGEGGSLEKAAVDGTA